MVIDGHPIITDPVEVARAMEHDLIIGVDTESSGFSPWRDRTATIQLYGDQTGTAALIRTHGGIIPGPIKELLQSRDKTLVVHNGVGFDMLFLHTHGVDISRATWYDTLVAETAIVPSMRRDVSKSLQASLKRRLGVEVTKDVEHGHWEDPELTEEQVHYAMADVIHLPALRRSQLQRAKESGVERGLNMEMRLLLPTAWLTINGMPISRAKLQEYLDKQVADIGPVTDKFVSAFGNINVRSPKQVLEAFASKGVTLPNTQKETLQDAVLVGGLAGELANILLEYRRPDQRIKVYGGDWIDRYQQADGRIHAKFWQCATDTTRFSSSDPNGEQIPRDMRYVFGWEEGKSVVAVDLSQIEIRVMAAIAKDQALMAALESEDIHREIASVVFGVLPGGVTFGQRKLAKAMSFTILFGGGVDKFYQYARLNGSPIPYEDVGRIVDTFFAEFRGVARLKEQAQQRTAGGGPVTVKIPSGLKRMLVGPKCRPTVLLNTLVQASAAAGIKEGMLEAWDRGLVVGSIGNQVHDELVAVVNKEHAVEYGEELRDALVTGFARMVDCKPRAEVRINDFWEK